MTQVAVLATSACNLASMLAALRRIDVAPRIVETADDAASSRLLVVPGVGAFGAVIAEIDRRGLRDALAQRMHSQRPTFAVCLGLQLLAESSEESPGVLGLGVLAARVTRFGGNLRVPQMGWNRVAAPRTGRILNDGYAYFANSYRLESAPADWTYATSDYGGPFIAAIERGPIVACQFHPELSGEWGQALFKRWIQAGCEASPC